MALFITSIIMDPGGFSHQWTALSKLQAQMHAGCIEDAMKSDCSDQVEGVLDLV